MAETVTIPKKEYNLLVKCKRIVESEFKEKFSEKFIRDIKKAEEEYKKGHFVRVDSRSAAKAHLDSL